MSEGGTQSSLPREFVPIEDAREALRLLKEGAKGLCSALVWTKDQKQVIHTHIHHFSDMEKLFYCWVPAGFDPAGFMNDLTSSGESDCFFSVSLTRANIFFRAKYLGIDSGGLRFDIPTRIFKVQRRKDFRLPTPDGYVLKVEFEDPLFPGQILNKKVLDVSAGGLAILVTETEQAMFYPGVVLKGVTFAIRNKKIVCEAEVRHLQAMPANSKHIGVKIGVLFKNINPSDVQMIAAHVLEQSRRFLSEHM